MKSSSIPQLLNNLWITAWCMLFVTRYDSFVKRLVPCPALVFYKWVWLLEPCTDRAKKIQAHGPGLSCWRAEMGHADKETEAREFDHLSPCKAPVVMYEIFTSLLWLTVIWCLLIVYRMCPTLAIETSIRHVYPWCPKGWSGGIRSSHPSANCGNWVRQTSSRHSLSSE